MTAKEILSCFLIFSLSPISRAAVPSLSRVQEREPAPVFPVRGEEEKESGVFRKNRGYSAGLFFFLEDEKFFPGIRLSMERGGGVFSLRYSDGHVPFVDDKYAFLRDNEIPVKRTAKKVTVDSSSITYYTDEINEFHVETRILGLSYWRKIHAATANLRFELAAGLPLAYNKYRLDCVLDDSSRYRERDSAFGAGLEMGFSAVWGSDILLERGFFVSAGSLYRKLWFDNSGASGAGRSLREELDGIKMFLAVGWMF